MGRVAFLVLLLLLWITPAPRAEDQVAMVEGQIQMARERLTAYRGELASALGQLQQNPGEATFARIRELQDKIQRQGNVVSNLQLALQDAQAAQSWSALISDMVRQSSVLSAGADVAVSVYQAGKWIFGASDDEIFGESWQQVESYNARLVEEARKIREESRAILKALDQIKGKIDGGGSADELRPLADSLTSRLNELRQRGDRVGKNLRLMVRIYRAEKENLPASTLFHGVFMGRYTEQVLAEFDNSKLTDLVLDLLKGDTNDILIKLVKPMVKTAVGDYLAKRAGGGNLTPEIIDDLSFSILFGGETGFQALLQDRLGDEAGGAAIKGLVKGVVAAEAQQVIGKSNQAFYGAMRRAIQNLPATADLTEHMLIQETTDQLVKEHKNLIESGARIRTKRLVDTGEAIKKVWDLVLKDAIQAWLQKDTFFKTVQLADESCLRFREEWRKVQNDMILTENEYVNYRWFEGGKSAAAPPKGVVGVSSATARQQYGTLDLDKTKTVLSEQKDLVEGKGGNARLEDFDPQEDSLVEMVCSGTIPFGRVGFTDLGKVVQLTALTLWAPCDELYKSRQTEIKRQEAICEEIRMTRGVGEGIACRDSRVKPLTDALWRDHQQCIREKVELPREEFTQRRITRLQKMHNCEAKRYKEHLERIRRDLGPAVAWAESMESDVRNLQELVRKMWHSGDRFPLPLPPLPTEINSSLQEEKYDETMAAERLARLKENVTLVRGVDLERLEQALGRVDFAFDDSILSAIPDPPRLCRKFEKNQYGGIECREDFIPLENEDFPLARERRLLSAATPFILQELLQQARQIPEMANPSFAETLLTFSPSEGMRLYREGMALNRNIANSLARLNTELQEFVSTLQGVSLKDIRNFHDYVFAPWKLRRNPTLLGMDLDQFKEKIREMKETMDKARKTVIPDPAPVLASIAETERLLGEYRAHYERYGTYRLRYFPTETMGELSLPDLSGLVRSVNNQLFSAETFAMDFKAASEELVEMEKELEVMERQEAQHLAELENYLRGMAAAVDQAVAACDTMQQDPEKCLKGVAAAREARRGVPTTSTVLSHLPSKKYRERRNELVSTIAPKADLDELEGAALAVIRQKEEQKARELMERDMEAPRRIAEFYREFRTAYEGRNDSQLISFLGDDWEAGDGTTLADLQGYLRNSFSVFDEIRYTQANLQFFPSPQGVWRVSYDLTITGRIYAENMTHEEKSTVAEELAFDPRGRLRIVRTIGGRFWSVR